MIQDIINASLVLRKVKYIECHEAEVVENIRPQMHVAIIAPFGSGKNKHILNKVADVLDKDCIRVGYPTKASILGTITKERQYNEGALVAGSGKVVMINEFSEMDTFARSALLEPMEDGMLNKELANHVIAPIRISKPYCKGIVKKGKINISKIWFTCIAGMMYWPERIYNENDKRAIVANQKGMGLLSRFLPIPIEPEFEELLNMLEGKQSKIFSRDGLKFSGFAPEIDTIVIEQDEYAKFFKDFRKQAEACQDEFVSGEYGLLGRMLNDMIRMALFESVSNVGIKKLKKSQKFIAKLGKNAYFFKSFFDFFRLRRLNLTELKVMQYISIHPNHSYQTMADAMGLTRRQMINVCNNVALKMGFGGGDA